MAVRAVENNQIPNVNSSTVPAAHPGATIILAIMTVDDENDDAIDRTMLLSENAEDFIFLLNAWPKCENVL